MKNILNLKLNKYRSSKYWDHGNEILYDLCRRNFHHEKDDAILTKVLFIGRIYAAAVERRKRYREIENDKFYTGKILQAIKKSKIDKLTGGLKGKMLTEENIPGILKAHHKLMQELLKITALEKRSFC